MKFRNKLFNYVALSALFFSVFEAKATLSDSDSDYMRDETAYLAGAVQPQDIVEMLSDDSALEARVEKRGLSEELQVVRTFLQGRDTNRDAFLKASEEFSMTWSSGSDLGRALAQSIGSNTTAIGEEADSLIPHWHSNCPAISGSESFRKYTGEEMEEDERKKMGVLPDLASAFGDSGKVWSLNGSLDSKVHVGLTMARMLLGAGTADDHLLLASGVLENEEVLSNQVRHIQPLQDEDLSRAGLIDGFNNFLLGLNAHLKVFVNETDVVPASSLASLVTYTAFVKSLSGGDIQVLQKELLDEIVRMITSKMATREKYEQFEANGGKWPNLSELGKKTVFSFLNRDQGDFPAAGFLDYVFDPLDSMLNDLQFGKLRKSPLTSYGSVEAALPEFTDNLEYSRKVYEGMISHIRTTFPEMGDFENAPGNAETFRSYRQVVSALDGGTSWPSSAEEMLMELQHYWVK
ncbi:MAG: hypothetical protein HON43_08105 [Alphaproteobacteria bacterium]|jgi:hypothetical protein|nr:hypothetical protein [Alphaproteobacteria bacterium]MBT5389139.1 hypothetical protein [Alphaproteobacteria bacterium]